MGKIKKNIRKKQLDSDPMFDKQYLRTKLLSYKGRTTTNLDGKLSKKGSDKIWLLLIVIDSVFKSSKDYCLEAFLEECKYKIIEKEKKSLTTDDLESSSDDGFKERDLEENFE